MRWGRYACGNSRELPHLVSRRTNRLYCRLSNTNDHRSQCDLSRGACPLHQFSRDGGTGENGDPMVNEPSRKSDMY